jgi:hypothetical protein
VRHALIALILTLRLLQHGSAWAQEANPSDAVPTVVDDASAETPAPEVVSVEAIPSLEAMPDQAPEPPVPSPDTCGAPANPWGFTFCSGTRITQPPPNLCATFACIPTFWHQTNGYVIECADGLLSHSGGGSGSCSGHRGNGRTLFVSR